MEAPIQAIPGGARVTGEMTVYTASALRNALLEALRAHHEGAFELDLSGVEEFDTAGLQLLLMLNRSCAAATRALRISASSAPVHNGIELCGQADLLTSGLRKDAST
jgi:anti-sigma B factor antagonist